MKSHMGGTLSLGKGLVYSTSVRQCLNINSSMEEELVATSDMLLQELWTQYFLED